MGTPPTGREKGPELVIAAGGPRDVGRHLPSPDGTLIAVVKNTTLELHNTADGRRVGPPIRQGGFIRSVSFAPDLASILTGSDDGAFRLLARARRVGDRDPLEYDDPT